MLTKCQECGLQVSDKALACPHCGYPLKNSAKEIHHKKSNKRRRLPNGFGQITEIKNKGLRKPFRTMVTTGKDHEGKCICRLLKPISYFSTYNEAYEALISYHVNPYDLDSFITVKELYERWKESYFKKLKSKSSERTITSAWPYCVSVYDMPVRELRGRHIKYCIDEGVAIIGNSERKATPSTKSRIKSLFNLMLDYGVEYELLEKNYARTFSLNNEIITESKKNRKEHIPFTDDEIDILWKNLYVIDYVDLILIQCYSGWRPQELGLIEYKNTDIVNWSFNGGMKTDAGTDRTVPIHTKIRPLVKRRYEEAKSAGSKYVFNCSENLRSSGIFLSYSKYERRFRKIIDQLEINKEHRPHDGRKHFVTAAKRYKVDEYAIKYIVGHEINDVTEKIYTKREFSWLQEEIEKIK